MPSIMACAYTRVHTHEHIHTDSIHKCVLGQNHANPPGANTVMVHPYFPPRDPVSEPVAFIALNICPEI